ncbi:MAG: formimidoylglutamase [Cyclobacteriaceae bacterium]
MNLKLFFSPLEESLFKHIGSSNCFYKSIHSNIDKMPDIKGAELAIIGVPEERGTTVNEGTAKGPDQIRKKLYDLKKGSGSYRIVDLGNLRPGHNLDETHGRLKEVCRFLLERNILPVILGGSHDLDLAQFTAYEDLEKLITMLNVDAFLDMEEHAAELQKSHVHKIMVHEPNFLFHYSHLAYQSYLVDNNIPQVLEMLYFESHRLGELRHNFKEMEPVIRQADMLSFDVSAIRSSDAPGNARSQPFGLTGEEACQICWYAGLNEKLSSAGFYEYNPSLDDGQMKTAAVCATMIWYFIEGFYHRKNEHVFKQNDYLKYTVSMPSSPATITFYKSKLSDKWWLEIPVTHPSLRYERTIIVPCSHSDYNTAAKGEVPDRYIHAQAKMA